MKTKIITVITTVLLFTLSSLYADVPPFSKFLNKSVIIGLPQQVVDGLAQIPKSGVDRSENTLEVKTNFRGTLVRIDGKFAVVKTTEGREIYLSLDYILFVTEAP